MSNAISPRGLSRMKYFLLRNMSNVTIVAQLLHHFPNFRINATFNGEEINFRDKGFITDDYDIVFGWFKRTLLLRPEELATREQVSETRTGGILNVKIEYHMKESDPWKCYLEESVNCYIELTSPPHISPFLREKDRPHSVSLEREDTFNIINDYIEL